MDALKNVLVIEDNPADARLVVAYLDECFGAQCAVRQAGTLAEGLQALRKESADVVLLDLGLPDSQGLDGYAELFKAAPGTPVVILTGTDDEDLALDALRSGAEDYLPKQDADGTTLLRAMRHAVQRRLLLEGLRASEARFRAIVETAEEGILQLGRDGEVAYLNKRARTMLGLDRTPQTDQPAILWFLEHVRSDEQEAAVALLRTLPNQRKSCELNLLAMDGTPQWVIAAAGGIAGPPGAVPQVALLLTAISALKQSEQELLSAKALLEARVRERTALLEAANADLQALSRAMAHDLRSPLSGIIGLTRLISREAQHVLTTPTWRRLQLVEQSALQMNQLISRLLSLTVLSHQGVQREPLDLSEMVRTLADLLEASDPKRQIRWKIANCVTALADRSLVASVLQNLVENAWKYSRTRAIAEIEFGNDAPSASEPVYFVRDNGVGFDMAQADRLFEAFERMASSRDHEGTGLGLFGVKRIVERHGGTVWAESTLDGGSTFRFTLRPGPAAS